VAGVPVVRVRRGLRALRLLVAQVDAAVVPLVAEDLDRARDALERLAHLALGRADLRLDPLSELIEAGREPVHPLGVVVGRRRRVLALDLGLDRVLEVHELDADAVEDLADAADVLGQRLDDRDVRHRGVLRGDRVRPAGADGQPQAGEERPAAKNGRLVKPRSARLCTIQLCPGASVGIRRIPVAARSSVAPAPIRKPPLGPGRISARAIEPRASRGASSECVCSRSIGMSLRSRPARAESAGIGPPGLASASEAERSATRPVGHDPAGPGRAFGFPQDSAEGAGFLSRSPLRPLRRPGPAFCLPAGGVD
jgi:hypothetical protein